MSKKLQVSSYKLPAHRKGFTLIELLVVATIIMILAVVVTINVGKARERSRDSQRKSILAQYSQALETYKVDKKSYPTYTGCQAAGGVKINDVYKDFPTVGAASPQSIASYLVSNKYLTRVLTDPSGYDIKYMTNSGTAAGDYKIFVQSESITSSDQMSGASTCADAACCDLAPLKNKAGDFCNPVTDYSNYLQVSSSAVALSWK